VDTTLFQSQPLQPQGLPVDDLLPATDLMMDVDGRSLPDAVDGSEASLDIGSATRGNRLVSTDQV